jgi:uncharacterized protein (TIGR03435 family)
MRSLKLLLVLIVVFGSTTTSGQEAPSVAFEVASIRPRPTLRQIGAPSLPPSVKVTPGRMDLTSVMLRSLIPMAFGVSVDDVEWPEWVTATHVLDHPRFDIQATIPAGVGRAQVPAMLRTLLVERFGLVARSEARPKSVYALVVQPAGHAMREVEPVNDLTRVFPVGPGKPPASDDTMTPLNRTSLVEDNQVRVIEFDRLTRRTMTARTTFTETHREVLGTWEIDATRMTMVELAKVLRADRPVVDQTGLTGVYQFKIEIPERVIARVSSVATDRNGNPLDLNRDRAPSGVSMFKAVEGLGLKLEARTLPTDVLVIERLARTVSDN